MRLIVALLLSFGLTAPLSANRIWSSGFELQSAVDNIEWDLVGGSPEISTTTVRSGAASGWIRNLASTTQKVFGNQWGTTVQQGPLWQRCYFRFTTFPSAENTIIAFPSTALTVNVLRVTVDNGGVLRIRDEDGLNATSATLSTGTWYRIELMFDRNGGSGTDEGILRVDGASDASITTGSWSDGTVLSWMGANLNGEAQTTGEWFIDDCGLNDDQGAGNNGETTWPGDGSIIHLRPNGEGDADAGTLTFTGCASGTVATCLDEITPDDATSFVGLDATTSTVDVAVDDFTDPGGIQIQFVQLGVRFTCEGTGACNYILRVKSQASGTVRSTTITPTLAVANVWWTHLNVSARTYKHTQYLQAQDNASRWVDSTLDAMQIGVATTDGNPDTNVTKIWALVEYETFTAPSTRIRDVISNGIIPKKR